MFDLLRILARALGRRANPWNWTLQAAGGLTILGALGLGSLTLFGCGAVLTAASLFELHLPPLAEGHILRRAMRAERAWLDAPWNRTKRIQALAGAGLGAALLASLVARDLGLGLLVLGAAVLALVGAAQSALMRRIEEDEDFPPRNPPES